MNTERLFHGSAPFNIDMVSLTDTNREAFFKQANEKLTALTHIKRS